MEANAGAKLITGYRDGQVTSRTGKGSRRSVEELQSCLPDSVSQGCHGTVREAQSAGYVDQWRWSISMSSSRAPEMVVGLGPQLWPQSTDHTVADGALLKKCA